MAKRLDKPLALSSHSPLYWTSRPTVFLADTDEDLYARRLHGSLAAGATFIALAGLLLAISEPFSSDPIEYFVQTVLPPTSTTHPVTRSPLAPPTDHLVVARTTSPPQPTKGLPAAAQPLSENSVRSSADHHQDQTHGLSPKLGVVAFSSFGIAVLSAVGALLAAGARRLRRAVGPSSTLWAMPAIAAEPIIDITKPPKTKSPPQAVAVEQPSPVCKVHGVPVLQSTEGVAAGGQSVWCIEERGYDEDQHELNETLFCLANGFIGSRGAFEEGYAGTSRSVPGTYINGFYESSPIKYAEVAYGYPEQHQTLLNVTSGTHIVTYVDGTPVSPFTGKISDYHRVLDMKEGTVSRSYVWEGTSGKRVLLQTRKVVSFCDQQLLAIEYTVMPLNFSGNLVIQSSISGNVSNQTTESDPRVGSALTGPTLQTVERWQSSDGLAGYLTQCTTYSGLQVTCYVKHDVDTTAPVATVHQDQLNVCETNIHVDGRVLEPITVTKYLSYSTSSRQPCLSPSAIGQALDSTAAQGYQRIIDQQKQYLKEFWEDVAVDIVGAPELQQGINFNMFHLLQSVGRDGFTSIAAKGLTGEGYEGHYFWDTEIYVFPFFLYTQPEVCRKLLEFRYRTLPGARNRARQLAHRGALYPWRTIMGDEASAYFPAGTAQYHINADIMYSLQKYWEATEDLEFLMDMGAEMLWETSRFWMDIGHFRECDGRFVINCVTGPDEYTALVNNNCYTNLMVQAQLRFAVQVVEILKRQCYAKYDALVLKIGLKRKEIQMWAHAAEHMFVPYDQRLGIHPQDDTFLLKEKWDLEATPAHKFPLLLHYHPLNLYRKQVCKQADLILAQFLLGDQFDKEQKRRDYEYYKGITTHDSSLSGAIFAIQAAELGDHDQAYEQFLTTARMDLDNCHHNTEHGIHTASMAGTWLCLSAGFGGMRTYGELSFAPWLPAQWEGYSFNVTYRGCRVNVSVQPAGTTYTLTKGRGITLQHHRNQVTLTSETPAKTLSTRPLPPQAEPAVASKAQFVRN